MADKDPKDMTDEELEQALNGKPAEPEQPEEPEPPEEPEEPEAPEPEEEEEPETPEKPPSHREQLRVQQLLAKLKEQPNAPPPTQAPDALDYESALEADPETVKRLREDRDRTNRAFYEQGLEQSKSIQFVTRLEIDAPRVESKYPFLDKTSEEFNPRAADALNTRYLQFVGYDNETGRVVNPNIRYSEFVEAEMEFANEVASNRIAESTSRIKKQAAQTGLRPDGSGAKKLNLNKPPETMTDEELDAVIAQAIPSK